MYFISNFTFISSLIIILFNPINSQQFYDNSNCASESLVHGSKYTCNSNCSTYIVYRAQQDFLTISSVASLFNLTESDLRDANHLKEDDSLSLGREIIIPVSCNCIGGFSQAIFIYNFSGRDSVNEIACGVFEGLVKAQSLVDNNPSLIRGNNNPDRYLVNVPIRCACPDSNQLRVGVKNLVTYPVLEGDRTGLIASKFGISEKTIWDANNLGKYDAIFPQTTLLVPTGGVPDINWNISSVPNNSPGPTEAIRKTDPAGKNSIKLNYSQVFLGAGICVAVISMILTCGILIYNRRKNHPRVFQPLPPRSSPSPDFLQGMSKLKHSLINFSLEEITIATQDFNESSRISARLYRGDIGGNTYLTIQQMDSEEAAQNVIDILTKIKHFNIVRLEGFCNESEPYLVFEYPKNGSLHKCLSNIEMNRQFTWARRIQIAFDLATALHYLHNSTSPPFVHHNINSENILITMNWRAKVSGFGLAKSVGYNDKPVIMASEENRALDDDRYLTSNQVSLKVDVYAFGVVLLELVSGKEFITYGKVLMNSVDLLLDKNLKNSSQFLEKLRNLMDPGLKENYPMGDAICLALLAKSCIEEDPDHRPTMNDVLIALSRIV
ncbi:protein LYK5-like [Mercurialis annua]|uniref:protein LYK5-like n=1 Tax=Mercurialis annua TaxID=3986 RepID=UPI00215F1BA7|nr:protein LYK5-like [Mercurialis annua]